MRLFVGVEPTPDFRAALADQAPPVSMTVKEVCLYRSVHEAAGMKYTVIGRSG